MIKSRKNFKNLQKSHTVIFIDIITLFPYQLNPKNKGFLKYQQLNFAIAITPVPCVDFPVML